MMQAYKPIGDPAISPQPITGDISVKRPQTAHDGHSVIRHRAPRNGGNRPAPEHMNENAQ